MPVLDGQSQALLLADSAEQLAQGIQQQLLQGYAGGLQRQVVLGRIQPEQSKVVGNVAHQRGAPLVHCVDDPFDLRGAPLCRALDVACLVEREELPEHSDEGLVGGNVAIGVAAPYQQQRPAVLDLPAELVEQPALPDAGFTDQRDRSHVAGQRQL